MSTPIAVRGASRFLSVFAAGAIVAAAPRAASAASAVATVPLSLAVPAATHRRVPLRHNFPWLEIGGIAALAGANVVLKAYEYDIAKARGAPLIGSPPAFDRWFSNELYRGPFASPFLLHAPELVLTEVGPIVYLSYRGVDTLALWLRGRALTPALNPDHKLFAFAEAYLLTTVINLGVKEAVGRERPFEALHRYGSDPGQPKTTLSFWSNQTATSFCLATFVWRDLSDWLATDVLAQQGGPTRVGLGRVAPGVLLFGAAAFDGYSRIVDQRHWFSDTVVGGLAGGGIAYAVYAYHFDRFGQPRDRSGEATSVTPIPVPGGMGVVGSF